MKLAGLLERLTYTCETGSTNLPISAIVYDTRKKIEPGACFVCISGSVFDGHSYVKTACEQGAVAVIAEHRVEVPEGVCLILTENTRIALARMSAAFFGYPASKMKMIGITGTKGKSTTACMIYDLIRTAGKKPGLIGTLGIIMNGEKTPSPNTTPESYILQELLAKMVEAGTDCVVMEVSSQGLKLHRVEGITFDLGVFLNLEPDHIAPNEHPDFADYLACKSRLFRQCRIGIVNDDDSHKGAILKNATCEVFTFGATRTADYYAENFSLMHENHTIGICFDVRGKRNLSVTLGMPGRFNCYNGLAAIAACDKLRDFCISDEGIATGLRFVQVTGRVENVPVSEHFTVMVDYAHNAMSLRSLLLMIREYQPKRLICVFGCGGNRAVDRRFEMGEISASLADLTVITSDNPRNEEPNKIITDIITGVKRGGGTYIAIEDRQEAIRYCIKNAQEGDVIVVAGKGHEDYQEIKGVKYKMIDRELILDCCNMMN